MSIREILTGKFRLLTHPSITVENTYRAGKQSKKDLEFNAIHNVGRSGYSPFDVRYGNQVILQFRHDYIR